jgi:ATP-dependent helicase/nuclease subunit B
LDATDKELLHAAERFLEEAARSANELDNYSARALLEAIQQSSFWVGDEAESLTINVRDWLESLPDKIRVGGSGPRPGCLHVDHILSGGHSGRKHTCIVGLDDSRFPGSGLNDPLLLDAERDKLSPDLPQASKELRLKLERFALLLARLRGSVNMSFSSLDLKDDRETFASPVVVAAYRILSGNREGDTAEMQRWLHQPASFAPYDAGSCLDETEWWLWRMCGSEWAANGVEMLVKRFPHLERGFAATRARQSAEFTVYDGLLPSPPPELDPTSPSGPVVSASRLETIGDCPLRYFFKYVLKIRPPEELEVDRGTWLDSRLFGELLHEVFYKFMGGLISAGRLPNYTRDIGPLLKILEETVERYAKLHPPPSQFSLTRQVELLGQAARIFLVEEQELCSRSRPMFLEAAIAAKSDFPPSLLNTDEPVRLSLPGGGSIRAQARIDRIDLTGTDSEPVYAIWDYKSGSTWKYEKPDPFWQGRVIQHALYLQVAAAMLKKKVSAKAEVSQAGFFFPGRASRGIRIRRWRHQMSAAADIIKNLCKVAATGCFLATTSFEDDCTFCDYLMICGDVKEVANAAKHKLQNGQNTILDPIRELRNIDK